MYSSSHLLRPAFSFILTSFDWQFLAVYKVRVKLSSKIISRLSYSKRAKILYVYLRKAKPIAYKGVPLDVFKEFAAASSPGAYYEDHIKHSYQQADVFMRNMVAFAVRMLIATLIGGLIGLAPHLLAGRFSGPSADSGKVIQQPAGAQP